MTGILFFLLLPAVLPVERRTLLCFLPLAALLEYMWYHNRMMAFTEGKLLPEQPELDRNTSVLPEPKQSGQLTVLYSVLALIDGLAALVWAGNLVRALLRAQTDRYFTAGFCCLCFTVGAAFCWAGARRAKKIENAERETDETP